MTRAYEDKIAQWRAERDASIRETNNWLALAGLFWLEPGENIIGTGDNADVILPNRLNLARAATLTVTGETVTLQVPDGVDLLVDGLATKQVDLVHDRAGDPNELTIEAVHMILLKRGERFAIRMWDNARPERKTFPGRIWFPAQPTFQITAEYHAYDPPKDIVITDIVGVLRQQQADGYVTFTINGTACQIDVFRQEDDTLYALFKDTSSGSETYPTGRYIVSEPLAGSQAIFDFNKAYNPPCAFTPYATCPIPPQENFLTVAIPAGEKYRPY